MGEQVIGVIAGNKQQFDEFVRNQPLDDTTYIYCDREEKVKGYRFTGIELVGTYYELKHYRDLEYDILNHMKDA